MEANYKLKQAQHFSTCRKVQDENSKVHQDLPDSRGMGIVDRSIRRLPSHPHPSPLKEIPKILPQVSGVPVLPTFRTVHSPQVFTMIVKEVKLTALSRGLRLHQYLDNWLIRFQSREEALVNTQAVVDLTQPLGWIINQEKSELNLTQVFFVRGLRIPPGFSLCKPPSLDRSHLCTPGLVAESCKRDERLKPSSQRPQYPTLYRRLKRRLGHSFRTKFYSRSVVTRGKRATHKRPRIESCLSGPETLQRPVSGPNSASCDGQLNCVAYINKQGGTHSAEMCALLWRIMTWCHHFHITLKARHIPGCLNAMADGGSLPTWTCLPLI